MNINKLSVVHVHTIDAYMYVYTYIYEMLAQTFII